MKCIGCGLDMVKGGFRHTQLGEKQTYICKSCKIKLTPEWPRMRFSEKDVMHAISLYRKGASSSKIKSMMEENGIHVSRWTIIKWYKKFG